MEAARTRSRLRRARREVVPQRTVRQALAEGLRPFLAWRDRPACTARPRRARAWAAQRRCHAAYPGNRRFCRCSSSPRPRREPSVLSGTKRSTTPCTPKSGEHEHHVAPRLALASIAITVSGMLGRIAATRSPAPHTADTKRPGDAGSPGRRAGDGTIGGGPGPRSRRQSHRRHRDGAGDSPQNSGGLQGTSARPACGRHRGSRDRRDLPRTRRNPRAGARNPLSGRSTTRTATRNRKASARNAHSPPA